MVSSWDLNSEIKSLPIISISFPMDLVRHRSTTLSLVRSLEV